MADHSATAAYLAIMELKEQLEAGVEASKKIQEIPFEQVSRATWALVQEHQNGYQALVKMMLDQMPDAAKLVGNDAVVAHIQAVTSAD